jgi:subtilisin family serine protease
MTIRFMYKVTLMIFLANKVFAGIGAINPWLFCLTPDTEPFSQEQLEFRRTGIDELDIFLKDNPEVTIHPWLPASEPHEFAGDIYLNRIYRVTGYPDSKAVFERDMERLSASSQILYTEKEPVIEVRSYLNNPRTKTIHTPDDPLYSQQWWIRQVQADKAWGLWDIAGGQRPGGKQIKVAIVDTGVEWTHPDLIDNIWRNLGEDANGNGDVLVYTGGEWQFDPGDLNNTDNDGNEYKDDLIGWDAAGSTGENADNDPMAVLEGSAPVSSRMHGTHCSGIVSATADNGIGIAGTAYDVSIMPVKAMADNDDDGYLYYGYQGIQYAYKAGADIISLSWGSDTYSSSAETVIKSARDAGSILVAAAGNGKEEGGELYGKSYPASYPEVISVTALGPDDIWGGWANYHEDVDIAAPGESILSTVFSTVGTGYQSWWGTSMATPIVAGSMALLMSYFPGQDQEWYIEQLLGNTDDIYTINDDPEYAGRLGRGRVNPYKAIAQVLKPKFAIHECQITVRNDDGDGLFNPGEEIEFVLTLLNEPGWQDGKNIRGVLRSSHKDLLVIDSLVVFPDLKSGETGTHSHPLRLVAEHHAVPGEYVLEFHVYSENDDGDSFEDVLSVPVTLTLFQKGFPVPLSDQIVSSVLVWDINNDGRKEIVSGTLSGNIIAWNDQGDTLPGFPIEAGGLIPGEITVGDLNGNDTLELVAVTTTGKLYIFNGWGKIISTFQADNEFVAAPAIGQIDGGDDLEIVMGTTGNQIVVVKRDGSLADNFPLSVDGSIKTSISVTDPSWDTPVLAYSTGAGTINLINGQGVSLSGWPVSFEGVRPTTPVVIAFENEIYVTAGLSDGRFVILREDGTVTKTIPGSREVIAEPTLVRTKEAPALAYPYDIKKVALINLEGDFLNGWPLIFDNIPSRIAAADLNNNGEDEVIAVSNNGKLAVWRQDGTMYPGFPLILNETTSAGPAVADLDGDGDAEIIVSTSKRLVVWDVKSQTADDVYITVGGIRGGGPGRTHRYDYTFTSVQKPDLPADFNITGIYPNPFNARTTLSWTQPEAGETILTIYDLTGRQVVRQSVTVIKGEHKIHISADQWSSGLYILRLTSGSYSAVERLVYLK